MQHRELDQRLEESKAILRIKFPRCLPQGKRAPPERISFSTTSNLADLSNGNVKLNRWQPGTFCTNASLITRRIICALKHAIETTHPRDPTTSISTGMNWTIGEIFRRRGIALKFNTKTEPRNRGQVQYRVGNIFSEKIDVYQLDRKWH